MAIANVVQRGRWIYIYDEKGRQTGTAPAGSEREDGLRGYTNSTVNVQQGSWIYTYDGRGRRIGTTSAW